jgi:hypothetical protein
MAEHIVEGKKLKDIGGRKYCEKNNPEFKQLFDL